MTDYTFTAEDGGKYTPSGSADDLGAALNGAWALTQHTGSPVVIYDHRDGEPVAIARVAVEWLD